MTKILHQLPTYMMQPSLFLLYMFFYTSIVSCLCCWYQFDVIKRSFLKEINKTDGTNNQQSSFLVEAKWSSFFCLLGHNLGAKFHTTYTMGPIIMGHRNLIIQDSQPYIKQDDSQTGLLSKMYPFFRPTIRQL